MTELNNAASLAASQSKVPDAVVAMGSPSVAEVDPIVPRASDRTYEKRDYQITGSKKAVDALIAGDRRVLLVSPTGTGKNHIGAMVVSDKRLRGHFGLADGEPLRVVFFAHKHSLLDQAHVEIGSLDGIDLVTQSVFSPMPEGVLKKGWHLSIFDEAHHEPMMTFQEKLSYLTDTPMLGLTATPERADKFSLKFDHVVVAITREEAVRQGFIAPATVHSVVDMGTLEKDDLLSVLVDKYGSKMERTLVYLKSKEQALDVKRVLASKGYRVAALIDITHKQFREIKAQFEAGELDFVVNCQKLDEGVDIKGVKGVIIARGVLSPPLLNQIIGRGTRIDEPECHVWQFVDPLKDNLDACSIVGRDVDHFLYYMRAGEWQCDQMSSAVMHDPADQIQIGVAQ